MKIQRKHRQLIVLGIAVVIIALGLVQALFKIELDRKTTEQVTFVLMIIAAALIFTKDKKKSPEENISEEEKGNDMLEAGNEGSGEPKDNMKINDGIKDESIESVKENEKSDSND